MKHKIAILFQGVNDQKENETQQPTNNDDDEDKDRQGQLRSKSKVETAKGKKVCDSFWFCESYITEFSGDCGDVREKGG